MAAPRKETRDPSPDLHPARIVDLRQGASKPAGGQHAAGSLESRNPVAPEGAPSQSPSRASVEADDLRWSVRGRLLTPQGQPLAGEAFLGRFLDREHGRPRCLEKELETDSDGVFLTLLPLEYRFGDEFRLQVGPLDDRAVGAFGCYPPCSVSASVPEELGDLVVRVGPVGIAGRCRNRSGDPLEGVTLSAGEFVPASHYVRTDERGRFRIAAQLPEEVTMRIESDRWAVHSLPETVRNGDQDVEIVLDPAGLIVGNVIVGPGARSLGLRHILFRESDGRQVDARSRSTEDGSFALFRVPPGLVTYRLVALHDEFGPAEPLTLVEVRGIRVVGGSVTRDARLVDIQLRDHVDFAILEVVGCNGLPKLAVRHPCGVVERRFLASDGRFVIVGPNLEDATATIDCFGYQTARLSPVESCTVELELAPPVRLGLIAPPCSEPERVRVVVHDVADPESERESSFTLNFDWDTVHTVRLPAPATYFADLVIEEGPVHRLDPVRILPEDSGSTVWIHVPEELVRDFPPKRKRPAAPGRVSGGQSSSR